MGLFPAERSILPSILGAWLREATSSFTLITPLLMTTSSLKSESPLEAPSLLSPKEIVSCLRLILSRILTVSPVRFPPNSFSSTLYASGPMKELGEFSTLNPFFSKNSIIVVCPTLNSLAT